MTVTKDHPGADLGATFPSALHSVAHPAILGVFSCLSMIAVNSSCGPNKMQHPEEPEEVCAENKESSETLHAPASSSPIFQGDGFSHLCAQFYSYEKGRKNSISEASKKT